MVLVCQNSRETIFSMHRYNMYSICDVPRLFYSLFLLHISHLFTPYILSALRIFDSFVERGFHVLLLVRYRISSFFGADPEVTITRPCTGYSKHRAFPGNPFTRLTKGPVEIFYSPLERFTFIVNRIFAAPRSQKWPSLMAN